MVTINEEFSFDDDDFSNEFWNDDGNSGGFKETTKKTGARKAIGEFGGEAVSGIKRAILDPSNQRRLLNNSLPSGFTAAFDAASRAKSTIKDIYSTTRNEMGEIGRKIADDAGVLNKAYGKFLPKRIREKISRSIEANAGSTYYTPTEEDEYESELDGLLRESLEQQRAAYALSEDTSVKNSNRIIASQTGMTSAVSISNKILSSIAQSSEKSVGVGIADASIARKNAQTTFRHYMVSRQILDVNQQMLELHKAGYDKLVHNTSLPEAVKITEWERTSQAVKNKLTGLATDRMTKSFGGMFNQISENLISNLGKGLKSGGDSLAMIMPYLAMSVDDGFGDTKTKAQMAGGHAGSMLTKFLMGKAGKKLAGKYMNDPDMVGRSNRILNFMDAGANNLVNIFKDSSGLSMLSQLAGLDSIISDGTAARDKVRGSAIGKLDEVVSWTKQNDIALNEVIPGWLGKIHHVLDIIRTGDENTPIQQYDPERGVFDNVDNIMGRAKKKMFDRGQLKNTRVNVNEVIKSIDPNKAIKGKDRQILARYIIETANTGTGVINPQALMSYGHSPLAKYDAKAADRIADALQSNSPFSDGYNSAYDPTSISGTLGANTGGGNDYQNALREANKSLLNVRSAMPDHKDAALAYSASGMIGSLADADIVVWDDKLKQWSINNDMFYDRIMGNGIRPKGPNSPSGGPGANGFRAPTPGSYSQRSVIDQPAPSAGASAFSSPADDGIYTSFQTELLETIERMSSRPSTDISNQLLESIRERLELGIPSGSPEMASPMEQNRKTKWYRTLLDGSMKLGRGAKSYFKFASTTVPSAIFNGFIKTPLRLMRGINDLPAKILGGSTLSKGAQLISNTSSRFKNMVGDIYVTGRDSAVLKAKDILSGEYFDAATGKPIRSFKDIKGAIKDKTGEFVIDAEEYAKGIYTIVDGKRKTIIGGVLKAFGSVLSSVTKFNAGGASLMYKAAMKPFEIAKDLVMNKVRGAVDVFVKGEQSPRLLGRIMKAGGYFNRDGSVIQSIADIKGDVVDASGETIMTVAEMAKGLVDKTGENIKHGIEKIWSMITKPSRMVKNAIIKSYRGVKGIVKLNIKAASSILSTPSKLFSKLKGQRNVDVDTLLNAQATDKLNDIYQLLDARMPRPKGSWFDTDGSGHRDGSREDVLSKRKSPTDLIGPLKPKEDGSKKGILGLLMALVGGVGGLMGTLRGWAGSIFGLMKAGAMTRLGTSALNLAAAVATRGKSAKILGKGAAKAGAMMTVKRLATSSMGKMAIAGGLYAMASSGMASDAFNGAWSALSGSDKQAYEDALKAANGGSSSGGGGGSGKDPEKLGLWDRVKNGAAGSAIGEIGAIATFPALAAMYSKLSKSKAGKWLPQAAPKVAEKVPKGAMGKAWNWLSKTTKGRMLMATLAGGAMVAGQHQLTGTGGESVEDEAQASYRNTLLMEMGLVGAAPWAYNKFKNWKNAKAAANLPKFTAMKAGLPMGAGVMNPGVKAVTSAAPAAANAAKYTPVALDAAKGAGALMPGVAKGAATSAAAAAAPAIAGGGLKAGAKGLLKGTVKHGGYLGALMGLYDAYNTEGTMVDKGLAFGKSFLETAAISKGFSLGGKLLTSGGRQALMQGGRSLLAAGGRQALMQGGRTALAGMATSGGGLASSIGAAVASPIGVAVIIGVAVGAAAYYGHKYFFGKDKNALVRYRFAQYGIDLGDKDNVKLMTAFEPYCLKHVQVTGDKASFKSNMKTDAIIKLFKLSDKEPKRFNRWLTWFENRFKPVLLNAVRAYYSVTGKTDITGADRLPKEDKIKLLDEFAKVDPRVYEFMENPFEGRETHKFTKSKVDGVYKRSARMLSHEKDTKDKKKEDSSGTVDNKGAKDYSKPSNSPDARITEKDIKGYQEGKKMLDSNKYWGSADAIKNNDTTGGSWFTGAKTFSGMLTNIGDSIGHVMTTAVAQMSGSQKQWQLGVYKACKNAGFSEQQARIMTAEIGRENGYNPKYLFGGHADPHKGANLGMLSWQGSRRTKLINFLAQAGVLTKSGSIIPSQAALDAQAKFMMWELKNTHAKAGGIFLSKPNISYKEGTELIGTKYILWRYNDPKYASGHKNRDMYYNMLLKQLNAKDGDTGTDAAESTSDQSGSTASNGANAGGGQQAAKPTSSSSGGGGGGWFGYMQGGGSSSVSSSLTAFGGGAVAAAGSGFESAIPAELVSGGVPRTHRAWKAAAHATSKANKKSTGYCAKFVANALQYGGYKFERQASAFMYANGPLASAGFKKISVRSKYQIGDVMVWPAHGKGKASGGGTHGHIQIFNGANWVSDFVQPSYVPGSLYNSVSPTLWRDSTLMGKSADNAAAGPAPSTGDAKASTVDTSAKKIPATIAKPAAKQATPAATTAKPVGIGVLKQPTSSFVNNAGRSSFVAAPATPVETKSVDTTSQTSSFLRTSAASSFADNALKESARSAKARLEDRGNDMVNLTKQQLEVQKSMDAKLGRLCELTEQLVKSGAGTMANAANSKDGLSTETPRDGNSAAAHMRGKLNTIPVSMSVYS